MTALPTSPALAPDCDFLSPALRAAPCQACGAAFVGIRIAWY